jgi:hypothetical protein
MRDPWALALCEGPLSLKEKPMTTTVKSVLSAFNSEAGTTITHDAGTAMVTLADGKSAYGRALRDVTAVALSGRWRDADGVVLSDNAIGHALGVAMRQPRSRLQALTGSGLVFHTDADIRDNAAVWAHVAKMYNAGKAGRTTIKETVEAVAAIADVEAKRAAWLSVAVPPRTENKRGAQPNDGTSDAEAGNLPTDTTERFSVAESDTNTLLSYLASIGKELSTRIGDMSVDERATFRDTVSALSDITKASAQR